MKNTLQIYGIFLFTQTNKQKIDIQLTIFNYYSK